MLTNKTSITKEQLLKIAKTNLRVLNLLMCIIGGPLLLLAVVIGIGGEISSAIFLGFLSIFMFCFPLLVSYSVKKQYNKTTMFAGDAFYEYSFDREYMRIQYSSDSVRSSQIAKWMLLLRVVESKDMFLLFIQNNQLYPIDKAHFTQGTAEELRMLIKEMCPTIPYKISSR